MFVAMLLKNKFELVQEIKKKLFKKVIWQNVLGQGGICRTSVLGGNSQTTWEPALEKGF